MWDMGHHAGVWHGPFCSGAEEAESLLIVVFPFMQGEGSFPFFLQELPVMSEVCVQGRGGH